MVKSLILFLFFSSPKLLAANFDFDGSISVQSINFLEKLKSTEQNLFLFNENFNSKVKFKKVNLYLKANAYQNSPTLGGKQNNHFELSEFLLDYKLPYQIRLKAGQAQINWGVIDGYSPLNMVQTQISWNPLASKKRSSTLIEFIKDFGDARVDLLFIPTQYPSLLPGKDSRWLPRETILNFSTQYGVINLPDNLNYSYKAHEQLNDALKNNYGLRLSYRFSKVDFYLTHFEGTTPSPQIRLQLGIYNEGLDLFANPDIGLKPVYYRQRTTGFSLVNFNDSFILRFESAYHHSVSVSDGITPWSFENVLGFEKSFQMFSKSFTFLSHYYYSKYPNVSINLPISHVRIYENSLTLAGRYSFSERTHVTLKYLKQLDSHENSAGGFEFQTPFLTESTKLNLGYDFIEGSEDSLLGTYRKNDQAYVKLVQYF